MEIFKIVAIVLLSIEILGTFIASCNGSEECKLSDVIFLSIALIYVCLS